MEPEVTEELGKSPGHGEIMFYRCYKGPIEVLPVQNTTGKDLLHFCSHSNVD